MSDLTPEALHEIETRCNAATEGPWSVGRLDGVMVFDGEWCILEASSYDHDNPMGGKRGPSYISAKDNALFAAHARSDIPKLVAEVRRLQEENARLGGTLNAVQGVLTDFNGHNWPDGRTLDQMMGWSREFTRALESP